MPYKVSRLCRECQRVHVHVLQVRALVSESLLASQAPLGWVTSTKGGQDFLSRVHGSAEPVHPARPIKSPASAERRSASSSSPSSGGGTPSAKQDADDDEYEYGDDVVETEEEGEIITRHGQQDDYLAEYRALTVVAAATGEVVRTLY